MQIPIIPAPVPSAAVPQEVVVKAVANPQAAQALVQHSVDPSSKSEKFNEPAKKKDDKKGNRRNKNDEEGKDKNDGHSVNISI